MIYKQESDGLIKFPWQYLVTHKSTTDFKIGEKVFLKCNPDVPMVVSKIKEKTVTTTWLCSDGSRYSHEFVPECILQYKYAGLLVYNDKYNVSLN